MAQTISFNLIGKTYPLELIKLEREKLYGWSEIEARNPRGELCNSVNYHPATGTILPSGALTSGTITPGGDWVDRSQLRAIDQDGDEAPLVESSFKVPVELQKTVSIDTFLEHRITAVYTRRPKDGVHLHRI